MAEYIEKSDVNGLVQIGWSGDAIVTAIINDGISSVPAIPLDKIKQFRNEVMNMNSIAIIHRLDKLIAESEE